MDYTLNTTTGNRPARVAPAGCKSGQPCFYVPPQYIFNGDTPKAGRELSRRAGPQYHRRFPVRARHGELHVGAVLRTRHRGSAGHLRPGAAGSRQSAARPGRCSPPTPRLLNALAQHFVDSGFDLKSLMREIANSRHLPAFQPLRRHVERRLGAVLRAQIRAAACGAKRSTTPSCSRAARSPLTPSRASPTRASASVSYAMQFPDVVNTGRRRRNAVPGQLPARQSRRPAAQARRLDSAGAEPDEQQLRREQRSRSPAPTRASWWRRT